MAWPLQEAAVQHHRRPWSSASCPSCMAALEQGENRAMAEGVRASGRGREGALVPLHNGTNGGKGKVEVAAMVEVLCACWTRPEQV